MPEQSPFPLKLTCLRCGDSALKVEGHHTHESGAMFIDLSCLRCLAGGVHLELVVIQCVTHAEIELRVEP